MKIRHTCAAAAFLGLSTLASAASAGTCTTNYTNDNFIALRSGPSVQAPRVRKLWFQTTVQTNWVTAGNWIRVKSGKRWGWVNLNLVSCW